MGKKIYQDEQSREKLKEGIDLVADILKTTLGPKGRNVIVQNLNYMAPRSMNDGYHIAQHIKSENVTINAGCDMVKEICARTNDQVGDGPQPLNSKILTPTGWTRMGEIKTGVKICGTDKTIQEVVGVFPKGKKEIYKVIFGDGRIVECCEDHLWRVVDKNCKTLITTTKELLKNGLYCNKSNGYRNYNYYVPISVAEFKDGDLILNPYTLGVLIGDGSLSGTGAIEISIGINKEHIIDKLKFPEGIKINSSFVEDKNYFRIKISGKTDDGETIENLLTKINLFGTKSGNKFIPKSYLYSSEENRKKLLEGLTDTDGHVNKRNLLEYSTISERLHDDIIELLRGLGKSTHSYLRDKINDNSYSDRPIYRISELKGYKHGNKIIDIEKTGVYTEMQCIKVSNDDNLYFTDNYILTHNTTSTAVLIQSLVNEGLKSKVNPVDIKKALNSDLENILKELKSLSKEVKTKEDIKNIATISGNNDEEIGNALMSIYGDLGNNASVIVEKINKNKIEIEAVKGVYFEKGYGDWKGFINNPRRLSAEHEEVDVLCLDHELKDVNDINPFLQKVMQRQMEKGKTAHDLKLVIIARNISIKEQIIDFFAINNKYAIEKKTQKIDNGQIQQVGFHCTVIEAPDKDILEDISIATGATIVNGQNGLILREIRQEAIDNILGKAEKVLVTDKTTTIIGGEADEGRLEKRIELLRGFIEKSEKENDKKQYEKRLNIITSGIGIIKAGGSTGMESNDRLLRVEDAILAVRAAIEEGISVGGGQTYRMLAKIATTEIMKAACLSIPNQIALNAGKEVEELSNNTGYNALTDKYEDLSKSGVIDSTKVIRIALEGAVSFASMFLTTSASIIEYKDKKE